jgi:hypothetical protein
MYRHLVPFFHFTDEQTTIIHGGAPGGDCLAGVCAEAAGCNEYRFPAEWKALGKKAGALRNIEMLHTTQPDAVVAFPLKGSIGTWHMVREARKRGIPTFVVEA